MGDRRKHMISSSLAQYWSGRRWRMRRLRMRRLEPCSSLEQLCEFSQSWELRSWEVQNLRTWEIQNLSSWDGEMFRTVVASLFLLSSVLSGKLSDGWPCGKFCTFCVNSFECVTALVTNCNRWVSTLLMSAKTANPRGVPSFAKWCEIAKVSENDPKQRKVRRRKRRKTKKGTKCKI